MCYICAFFYAVFCRKLMQRKFWLHSCFKVSKKLCLGNFSAVRFRQLGMGAVVGAWRGWGDPKSLLCLFSFNFRFLFMLREETLNVDHKHMPLLLNTNTIRIRMVMVVYELEVEKSRSETRLNSGKTRRRSLPAATAATRASLCRHRWS